MCSISSIECFSCFIVVFLSILFEDSVLQVLSLDFTVQSVDFSIIGFSLNGFFTNLVLNFLWLQSNNFLKVIVFISSESLLILVVSFQVRNVSRVKLSEFILNIIDFFFFETIIFEDLIFECFVFVSDSLEFVFEVALLNLVLLNECLNFCVLDFQEVLEFVEFTFKDFQFTFV